MRKVLLVLWGLLLYLRFPVVFGLAHPELDLTDPVGNWWMHDASEADVRDRMSNGFRLIRLNVRQVQPLHYTATFVSNDGPYRRTGTDWAPGLTKAQVNQIVTDPTRRIIHISPYVQNSQILYAVVWVGKTATQVAQGSVALSVSSLQMIRDKANAEHRRVINLQVINDPNGGDRLYTAVLVDQQSGGDRCQLIGEGTIENLNDQIFASETDNTGTALRSRMQFRVIALHPVPKRDHLFVWVAENLIGNEKPWWFADMVYLGFDGAPANSSDYITDPAGLPQVDNVGVLDRRLDGRIFDLKFYSWIDNGDGRYLALVTDNSQYPQWRAPGPDLTLQSIDQIMLGAMKKWGVPGGTIAVTQGPRLVYAQGYGYTHVSRGPDRQPRRTEPQDLFRIASCSKSLTSLAIQKMIEQGKLTLDTTPFGQIFTEVPQDRNLKKLTIRQILQHKTWFPFKLSTADSITKWTNFPPPAVFVGRDTSNPRNFAYRDVNYHLLTLVIDRLVGNYETYIKENFLTPLGIQRMRISHKRATSFNDSPIEAANYDDVTVHNRRYFPDGSPVSADSGDWIQSSPQFYGASSWAVSPVDMLRLMISVDGTLPGTAVLNGTNFIDRIVKAARLGNAESTDPPVTTHDQTYVLGFSNNIIGTHHALEHSGYFPGTNAQLTLRDDGIKFFFAFNGDMANGYNIYLDAKGNPSNRGARFQANSYIAGEVRNALHSLFNSKPLPSDDHWADFGFSPAPSTDCTNLPVWKVGFYASGTKVQSLGKVYLCKPGAVSGWCGQIGYKPGIDANWQDAWEQLEICGSGIIGGKPSNNDCSTLSEWQARSWMGGDFIKQGNKIYQCRGWPQTPWCSLAAYEPGVASPWQDAWILIGTCGVPAPPPTPTQPFTASPLSSLPFFTLPLASITQPLDITQAGFFP